MQNIGKEDRSSQIEKNIIFVSTIYESFEALEETLYKLKMEKAKFLVAMAKNSFAKEVFKYAYENNICVNVEKEDEKRPIVLN